MASGQPTTISYAILGQLSIRAHSAYELSRLGRRWRDVFWTTAESVVYAELGNLVRHGLATTEGQLHGRRRRAVYAISDDGRVALRAWLAVESAPLVIRNESMLKVLFADSGTKQDLLRAVGEIRAWAEDRLRDGREIATGYLDGSAPYTARTPIVTLTFSYTWSMAQQMLAWADEAEQEIAHWPDSGLPDTANLDVFRRAVS